MNELQIFQNEEFGSIRTVEQDGKVLFCGTDVAKALGYSNAPDALARHCRYIEKFDTPHPQSPSKQITMTFIPEGDVYRLVIRAKIPSAEKFERWVCDEVIPSIRKTGGYIAGQEQMSDSELMAKALLVAQRQIEDRNKLIDTMKPKALFADAVSASHTSILIGDLAKILNQNGVEIGQKRLFAFMRDKGYLIKSGSSRNMPTQRSMDLEIMEVKESTVSNPDGSVRITRTTKITGKGQQYFINLFLSDKK